MKELQKGYKGGLMIMIIREIPFGAKHVGYRSLLMIMSYM